MLRYYYRKKNQAKTTKLDEYKSGAWVYAQNPNEQEIEELTKKYELDEGLLFDALDEDEMPRMERDGEYTYIYTRFPYTNDTLHIETSPVLFIVGHRQLITISLNRLSRLDKFLDDKLEYSTSEPVHLLLQILDEIDDEYEAKLNGISRQIKKIRSRLKVEEISNKDFIDFVLVEDVLNEFISALAPTNSILKRLLVGKQLPLHETDADIVEDLMLNNEQSIEACRSTLKTIVNIREAYSTIMTNNLNRVIRLLTVLTVILSFPTLIASIYGMNVSLPFEKSNYAFAGIMIVSLIVSIILLLVFKKRRWL